MTHARLHAIYVAKSVASIAVICGLLFVPPPCAVAQQTDEKVTAATGSPARELTLDVTVTDEKGRYLTGLTKEQFTLTDSGASREIISLSDAAEPASIGVLFDISGSMREGRWNAVEDERRAFARLFKRAVLRNEYFLWAFNKTVTELTGWTRDEAELGKGLNQIAPKTMPTKGSGATAIYDACSGALDKLAGGSHRKRVLLIFTDGQDNVSRITLKMLKHKIRESEVLIYPVALIEPRSLAPLDASGQAVLDELASLSGGRAFFSQGTELWEIIDRISIELSHQFTISFVPADAAQKGELNKLRVKVKPPPVIKNRLYVRHREGYFTPE